VARNNPMYLREIKGRDDKQRTNIDFFLRVFAVFGILVYVGQHSSLDKS